mmetsp:Transcript_18412/g.45827  ORF Transcript_18412/g.45827 Transcript_18412/m.45827 type:complete len:2629 (-) Transcript_18412:138-8024(-)
MQPMRFAHDVTKGSSLLLIAFEILACSGIGVVVNHHDLMVPGESFRLGSMTTGDDNALSSRQRRSSWMHDSEVGFRHWPQKSLHDRTPLSPGHGNEAFEGCLSVWGTQPAAAQGMMAHARLNSSEAVPLADESGCKADEVVLENQGLDRVVSGCCPRESMSCAGCAQMSGGVCVTCRAGFQSRSGICVICKDTAGWVDDQGDSCNRASCSDVKHHGLSSNQSCCKCGGGQEAPTPFAYPTVNLLLGASIVPSTFFPVPRTASRYSVNMECELGKYGITINEKSGLIQLDSACKVVGCGIEEPFEVSCIVTAHQTSDLSASTTLVVSGSLFAYVDNPLVARPDRKRFPPIAEVSSATMVCNPSGTSSWLSLASDGVLEAEVDNLAAKGGLTDSPHLGLVGGRCSVRATSQSGKKVSTTVTVFAPQIWPSFSYGTTAIFAAVGEAVMPLNILGENRELLAPGRFSASCTSDVSAQFAFDAQTGIGTIDGHLAFTLDVAVGTLHVTPTQALEKTLDDSIDDDVQRKTITLSCRFYGYYDEQPKLKSRYATSPKITMELRDNSCWVQRTADFAGRTNQASGVDLKACRKACRESAACTDFLLESGVCYFMNGLCTKGESCPERGLTVRTKIPNCGERSTCIAIVDPTQMWISGDYCPTGENSDGPVYLKEGRTIPETLYLAKYNSQRDGLISGCTANRFVLKRTAPDKDFDDPESSYIELKGESIKCLPLDQNSYREIFTVGSATSGGIRAELTGLPCGAPNTTTMANDGAEDQAEEQNGVSALVLDDPATSEPADHWMHPCDCFPERWGANAPVTAEAFEVVPAGSNNMFSPAVFEVVVGEFVCPSENLIDGLVIVMDASESRDTSFCEVMCKEKSCAFFWEGEVQSSMQCRLYNDCATLVRETGSKGTLRAVPTTDKRYCHVADPEKCWAVTGRRSLLQANRPEDRIKCAAVDLVAQCDHKLLMGGQGVETCSRCVYRDVSSTQFLHKARLPDLFAHGQKLGVSCWEERYRAMTVNPGFTASSHLTCMSGKWVDNSGAEGLGNFACAPCLQIASPPYAQLDARDRQELYFLSIMEVQILVKLQTSRIVLRSGSLDGQLDSSLGPNPQVKLLECQGDCDSDDDCESFLKCFQRNSFEQVPGCSGKGTSGWDYCYVPSASVSAYHAVHVEFKLNLGQCEGSCMSDLNCVQGLKCWQVGAGALQYVPGCSGIGMVGWGFCYNPLDALQIDNSPGADGKKKLQECQGDCDSDSDCDDGLECFQAKGRDSVIPGCAGTPITDMDYCYQPTAQGNAKNFVNKGSGYSGNSLGICEGDCDGDHHCATGLKCYQRDSGEDAPGCLSRPSGSFDVCYDPTAPTRKQLDSSPGDDGANIKLGPCEGDCDADSDCETGLACVERSGSEVVPWCQGATISGRDYCSAPTPGTPLKPLGNPWPEALDECQGDCDNDGHCKTGLECFQRDGVEPVPGCEGGDDKSGWDYCYDPTKAQTWQGSGASLDVTGFVMETVPALADDQRVIESSSSPGLCLEVVPASDTNPAKGLTSVPCTHPPPETELISAGDLPMLLQEKYKDASLGLVSLPVEFEVSSTFANTRLQDFVLEQDCGEHALNAFGWKDGDSNGKLEIFASCTQASNIGSAEEHVAVLGGILDVEFTTCTSSNSDTSASIYYKINSQAEKKLGSTGREKGQIDKFALPYSEPFNSLTIRGSSDGWRICRLKFSGEEVPTASLALNIPELPCFVDNPAGGDSCSVPSLQISGNRMQQELAHARIECGPGQALSYLKKEANRFVYKCSFVAGLGSCTPGQTVQVDTSSGLLDSLSNVQVACPGGEVLQSMLAEESVGGRWLRYRYTCCGVSAVPMAIVPTGRRVDSRLAIQEGLYCPTIRDVSGRPRFERVFAFRDSQHGIPSSLAYQPDTLQWCIGNSCLTSDAPDPLEAGFTGTAWEAVPVSDFDGQFIGQGVGKSPSAKGGRKKPELIKFGATQPKYAEECKDEVTPGSDSFDVDEMNKLGLTLPPENPCRLIAGRWEPQPPEMVDGKSEPQPNKAAGDSAWTEHGYDGQDGVEGAGTTYDSVRACGNREISRDLKAAEFSRSHDKWESWMGLVNSIYTLPCALSPNAEVAPFGVGIEWSSGDTCSAVMERVGEAANFINDGKHIDREWDMANNDNADCNSLQHGLSRIFCDLHCIRDAVKAGDKAILKSLENAVGVVGKNTDLLMEYYTGGLQDQMNQMASTMADAVSASQGGFFLEAKRVKSTLNAMFFEVSKMLGDGNLGASSRATVQRSISAFAAHASLQANPDSEGNDAILNASTWMTNTLRQAADLRAVVSIATSSGDRLSASAAVASRSAAALAQLQQVVRARVHVLGVYKAASRDSKRRQMHLSSARPDPTAAGIIDVVEVEAARDLLVELDQTWWSLRNELDNYLEAADEQAAAYKSAFTLLEEYSSKCVAGFSELRVVYSKALRAEERAHRVLHETWGSVSNLLGLLAAKIEDGAAFLRFSRLDAASVTDETLGSNRLAICHGDRHAAAARVQQAVDDAAAKGLAGQTWSQLRTAFMEVPMLRGRFSSGGLTEPDASTVIQAWWRVSGAYQKSVSFEQRGELALEVADRLRRFRGCPERPHHHHHLRHRRPWQDERDE